MKRQETIHVFDPVIYPVKLWITFGEGKSIIEREFVTYHEEEIIVGDMAHVGALTYRVFTRRRKGYAREAGIVIVFRSRKDCDTNAISHETTHAVDFIWGYLGENPAGMEASAYLAGWISGCIEKARKYKAPVKKQRKRREDGQAS